MIASQGDIKQLGTILAVWAHPDDETYCAGGILAAAIQNGQRVICVTATRGEKGVQDVKRWPADKLATIRTQEMKKACATLGITEHHWLAYKDGECRQAGDAGEALIREIAQGCEPDSILSFGPDGLTGHLDHQAVSAWATNVGKTLHLPVYQAVMAGSAYVLYKDACVEAKDRGVIVDDMFFNVHEPPVADDEDCAIHLKLDDNLWKTKLAALQAMPSQTEKLLDQLGPDYYRYVFQHEAFVKK